MEINYQNIDSFDKQMIESRNYFTNQKFWEAFKVKQYVTAAPTYTPNNFFDQIVFAEIGGTKRLYLYVNGGWAYVNLTNV